MSNEGNGLREFGRFRLDPHKRVLWCEDEPVNLPLKEIELLCVLTEQPGEVVTKNEIIDRLWAESFVEETNFSRHIYLIRRTFRKHGEEENLIQTVPRRGYRFAGDVRIQRNGDLVIERHTITKTLIEQVEAPRPSLSRSFHRRWMPAYGSVAIVALALLVYLAISRSQPDANRWEFKSIAVLPPTSSNDDPEEQAIAFGFAGALATSLGGTNEIRVVSANSALQRAESPDSVEVGRQLGVDAVLDGTIQRTNGKIRVAVRLLRTSDGVQVWSGFINDSETELFRLQDSLALMTAQALSVKLGTRQDELPSTGDLEAYRLYLKGDHLFRQRGNKNNTLSIGFFRQAVKRDPNFARAWAALAAALAMGSDLSEAENAVNKAIELDPGLSEANATRGFIQMFHHWKWDEAERSLNRAVELDRNSLQAHHWRGVLYSIRGRLDEAKAEMFRALELDPVSLNLISDIGQLFYLSGELDLAEEYCLKALAIDPEYGFAHGYLRHIYELKGNVDKAFDHLAKGECAGLVQEAARDCEQRIEVLRRAGGMRAYYESGKRKLMAELAGRLPATASRSNAFYALALIAIKNGSHNEAIEFLNRSLENKEPLEIMNFTFPYVGVDPQFQDLRTDPDFVRLLRRLDLVPA